VSLAPGAAHRCWPAGEQTSHPPGGERRRRAAARLLLRRLGARALGGSELVALDVEDLTFNVDRGLLVTIRASKTRPGLRALAEFKRYLRTGFKLELFL
jgi:hypothetical protein